MEWDLTELTEQARRAARELCEAAALRPGDLLVVGCSSSEVTGHAIGSFSSTQVADARFEGIFPVLSNRALILEGEAARAHRLEVVNAVPQPKAGGAFATAAYREFSHPVAVERVRAQAGMDIGDTLIGMHLRPVAVPVRLSLRAIGQANLVCARTRPRYIGGERAHYDPALGGWAEIEEGEGRANFARPSPFFGWRGCQSCLAARRVCRARWVTVVCSHPRKKLSKPSWKGSVQRGARAG